MRLSKEAKSRRQKFLIFVGLSLAIHFFLIFGVPKIFPNLNTEPVEKEPLMVELDPTMLKNLENERQKQIVNTEQSDTKIAPKDAKYLGEHNQSVEKETKARVVDTFRQGGSLGQKGQSTPQPQLALKNLVPKQNFDAKPTAEQGDIKASEQKRQVAQQAVPQGGGAPSAANSDYLKDVNDGDKTLLNTKEFVYFGYYNRIRIKLEQAWNSRLRTVFEQSGFAGHGRTLASNQSYYTRVVVELDRHGRITAVQLLEASGARELDRAAVEAFNQAGPFPDPPSGLIDQDGKIRVPWGFNVST